MNAPSPAPATQLESFADPLVTRSDEGGIALIVLNRPKQQNTFTEAMLTALTETLTSLGADASVRAVVLAANGNSFCAGHDLKEITEHRKDPDGGRGYTQNLMDRCNAMMQLIQRMPQPVIAAIEGVATAAGCQLVATCDLAVAAETARFATPGVNIGLFCSTPMVALSRNVAPKHAMEMLLTGEMVSAQDAHRIGLVNRVVPAGQDRHEAIELARKITSKSALTLKTGKEAFYRQIDMTVSDAYRYASAVMVENMMRSDAKEGITAFVEKREPRWDD
jgi:enoyl-CoA hydratase/carnithine racemase